MKVLVTGAGGCLGKLVVSSLRAVPGLEVWTSSRRTTADARHAACDLADGGAVGAMLQTVQPDLVFQLAGSFTGDYARDVAVNADSARHLFDAACRLKLRPRFVLIGSAAEYGPVEPEENPVDETRALRPVSAYGVTKAYQTLLAGFYAHQHHMDVVVARLFNLYAAGLSERLFVGRVEHLIEQFKRGERATIELGNLSSQRDYISGELAVEQIFLIATRGIPGHAYNVGTGVPVPMRELLTRMLNDADLDMSIVRETPAAPARRGYDVPVIYADLTKTRALQHSAALVHLLP
jgi:GDP-4-dehydro-6-deoxy-D-mannose reductase